MQPLHEFNRGLQKYHAQRNGLLLDAQYRAFSAAFGLQSVWVALIPLLAAVAGLILGFLVCWGLESRVGHFLSIPEFTLTAGSTVGVGFAVLSWFMSMSLARRIKYGIAYTPLQIFQSDKNDPTTIAYLPMLHVPRLAYLLRPGYFHGPAEASGIARGVARVQLPAEAAVMDLTYSEIFGEFCRECDEKQESNPKCEQCKPGLLPVTKNYFLGIDEDGDETLVTDDMVDAELFVGAGAVETRDLLRDGLEKGMLDTAADKKKSAIDTLKDNWQWIAGIILLVLVFVNITTGSAINVEAVDVNVITDLLSGEGGE